MVVKSQKGKTRINERNDMKTYEDWITKYYPKEAKLVSRKDALEHSILKWSGLFPEILKEYNIKKTHDCSYITSDGLRFMSINAYSCALCVHYWGASRDRLCKTCPLAIVRGNVPCDQADVGELEAPFETFVKHGNPEPMLLWLLKARKIKQELTKETI